MAPSLQQKETRRAAQLARWERVTGLTKEERDVRRREKSDARAAMWRQQNPDRARAIARKYKPAPVRSQANARRYAQRHGERIVAARKRRYAANAERLRENRRRLHAMHPDQRAQAQAKRRARARASAPKLTVFERAQVLGAYAIARARTMQTGIPHHVDHIVPLARGGRHHPSNLQVLTATENLRKGIW